MNIDNLCMSCMHELHGEKQCPNCGYYTDSPQISPYLPLRTPVGGKYIIGKVLSSNSEGVTYIAFDVEKRTPVVIREFLPEKFAERSIKSAQVSIKDEWRDCYYDYLKKFLELWRKLARVRGLSALIPVIDIIEENNTAYAVTEYFESISLREFLLKSNTGYLNWEKAKVLFMPVLSTLSTLHNLGIVHYGINPDNLLIGRDGKLRISGFCIAEARLEGTDISPELFEGYTPIEQYSYGFREGVWSDVYAFCAVLYRALVGTVPQDAVSRCANDRLIIPARYAEIIPAYVINALMNGLQVEPNDRTQDVETLREELSATPGNVVSSISGVNVPTGGERKEPAKTAAPVQEESSAGKTVLITFLAFLGVGLILFGAGWLVYEKVIKEKNPPVETTTEAAAESVEVPDFVFSTVENSITYDSIASNPVQNKRFKIQAPVYEYSATVPKDYIIAQSVKAGSTVPAGTEITFTISKGPEMITVPQVVGDLREFALVKLEEAGFKVDVVIKENTGEYEADTVASVTPAEGESIVKGSKTVILQVWGEPPTTETTTKNPFDFNIFG